MGFFITGISSYLQKEMITFIKIDDISFIPQGIVMTFYGMVGILISELFVRTFSLPIPLTYMVAGVISLTEIKSIFENIETVTGVRLWSYVGERLTRLILRK
jgi:hypothetical protein